MNIRISIFLWCKINLKSFEINIDFRANIIIRHQLFSFLHNFSHVYFHVGKIGIQNMAIDFASKLKFIVAEKQEVGREIDR